MNTKETISTIKTAKSFTIASKLLKTIDSDSLTLRNQQTLGRVFHNLCASSGVKIGLLSNFTTNLLPSYLSFFCATEDIKCTSYTGEFNQYFQEIIIPKSGLQSFQPDIIFINLSLKLLEPDLCNSFSDLSNTEKINLLDHLIDHLGQTISNATKQFSATVLLANFPLPPTCQHGIADNNNTLGELEFYYKLNSRITELVKNKQRVHIFDMVKLSSRFGSDNIYDPKMYYMAKMMWSEQFSIEVSKELLRYIWAIKGKTRKCLVLDLDNTLWGGILGEDGIDGVKVGQGDPVSEAYLDFQYKIKSLKNRGIMLSICSKNNENDVIELFKHRKNMPLALADFSAMQINWEHKHLNIQRIARDLNIGLDSIVFIDDNPVECDLVRQMIPEVKTVLLPKAPESIPSVIDNLIDFEKIAILADDQNKTEQYQQNKKRNDLKSSSGDLTSYLKSLKTEIWIRPAAKENIVRVHQLFSKTNQFNVTTKRYSQGEIENFLANKDYDLGLVSSRDRFGDLGIIGLYLLQVNKAYIDIDSFILSCRAMGRGIEKAIMNHIKKSYSAQPIEARYIPTKKNLPVKTFFEEQHFETKEQQKGESNNYILLPEKNTPVECSWIKLIEKWYPK